MKLHGVADIDVEQVVAGEAGDDLGHPHGEYCQYWRLLISILSRL